MPTIESDTGDIYFETVDLTPPWIADPEAILFHHGIGTNSLVWTEWLPVLADRYRLIRFDMPGFGRSAIPPEGTPWTVEMLAANACAVAEAAGHDRFHFVGESLGGTIGLYLAAQDDTRLLSLTASNAAHLGQRVDNVVDWGEMIDRMGADGWSRQMMAWRFPEGSLTPAQYDWYHATQSHEPLHVTIELSRLLLGADLGALLPHITVPTLLLSPDASPFIPLKVMQEMKEMLPDAQMHVFANTSHGLPLTHAAESAALLRDFLMRRD
jgi:pimeloyl-ACP methyl ester carboxylesterase